jgi:hypothetical protein
VTLLWGAQCRCRSALSGWAVIHTADNAFGLASIDLEIFDRLGLILWFDLLA